MKSLLMSLLLLMVAAAGNATQPATGRTVRVSDDISLLQLTDKLWVHVSEAELPGFGRFASNGLIVAGGGAAFLIDSPVNDELTETLVEYIVDSLHLKVTGFIPTHWHADCMGGIGCLHKKGIPSYAYRKTIEIATAKKNLPVPQNGFDDTLTLTIGTTALICRFPGAGHSLDNCVVWIPSEKLLFGGCLVKGNEAQNLGNVADGDRTAWPGSIGRLMRWYSDARTVIPGHGAPGGFELLRHTASLLASAPGK
jgi:metallo-beta-lactamase class B